jgi:hypothetical protein
VKGFSTGVVVRLHVTLARMKRTTSCLRKLQQQSFLLMFWHRKVNNLQE